MNGRGMLKWVLMVAWLLAPAGLAEELAWKPASDLGVRGRGWPVTAGAYSRLPEKFHGKVSEAGVWANGQCPAGLYVAFTSNAPRLEFRWRVNAQGTDLAMPHMPETGVSGCDLYSPAADGSWRYLRIGIPWWQNPATAKIDIGTPGKDRTYLLFLPLYARLESLDIGIPAGFRLEPADPFREGTRRPIVFYGTSITQGACASRAGMAYSSIVMRKLGWPVVNLGFNGAALLEPEVAGMLADIDAQVYVIDALKNVRDKVYGQPGGDAELRKRIRETVQIIRARRPDAHIVFVGESHYLERHPTAVSRLQESVVRELQAEGIRRLHILSGKDLLGSDGEGTTDGVHPNDLGMMRHADILATTLRPLLQAK